MKTQSYLKHLVVSTTLTLLPILSLAANGGSDGGGGQAVVCRKVSDDSLVSIQLRDLWEGEKLYQRKMPVSTEPIYKQVAAAISRAKHAVIESVVVERSGAIEDFSDSAFEQAMKDAADIFLQYGNTTFIPGIELPLTDEPNDGIELPKEAVNGVKCEIKQVVHYYDYPGSVKVKVNKDLYDLMPDSQKVALIFHEAFYAALRAVSTDQNALRVRRAVSLVMSGYEPPGLSTMVPHRFIECSHEANHQTDTLVLIYKVSTDNGTAVFETIVLKAGGLSIINPYIGSSIGVGGIESLEQLLNLPKNREYDVTTSAGGVIDYDFSAELKIGAGKKFELDVKTSVEPVTRHINMTCRILPDNL